MSWTTLCDLNELKEGQGKYVEIDQFRLAVFLHEGTPFVMDNTCPHAGAPMSQGWIDNDGCAVCPLHGWAFRLKDGCLRGGTMPAIAVYPVRIKDFEDRKLVQVDLEMA